MNPTALIFLMSLATSLAFASGTKLNCRSLDKTTLVPNLQIEVSASNSLEELNDQTVEISWDDQENKLDNETKVNTRKMDLKAVTLPNSHDADMLTGFITLKGDFGDLGLTLMPDYDEGEMIAIVNINTDGPITKQVYRCK